MKLIQQCISNFVYVNTLLLLRNVPNMKYVVCELMPLLPLKQD